MSKVMEEVHLTTIKPKNNVLLLAQEISFAKVLACNDKRLRDRGVKRLKKWFMTRSQGSLDFIREDHMRIWKGLFYCMWMSDKPLIQEELAEQISNLIHSFASFNASLLFVETFFASLAIEWFGIDQLRLDKFMMLVRRFMRQSLELVARIGWPEEQVQQLGDVYYRTLSTAPTGLSMHIIEVFCEELAKVGNGELSSTTVLQFITLFACFMATLKDGRLISQITRCIFLHLIRQTELGIEHEMKFSVWKEFGFPGGDVDAAEKIDEESDLFENEMVEGSSDEEERVVGIDARAGKVDVLLAPLDFDPRDLLKVLKELRNKKDTTTKARKTFIQLINKFENLAEDKYPLGLHKVDLPNKTNKRKEIVKAAKRLYVEEQKLIHSGSDDEEESVLLKKKTGKKNVIKQNKSIWRVSEAVETDHNESGSNTSWKVSESGSKDSLTPVNLRKRKLDNMEDSILFTLKNKRKKAKASLFSVMSVDSKENSLTSVDVRTPIKLNSTNILKKAISNNQNISKQVNQLVSKVNIVHKHRKKSSKQDKDQISKEKTNIPAMTEYKSHQSAITREETITKTSDDITNSATFIRHEKIKNAKNEQKTDIQLNTSKTNKNNGWGGEWDEPLNDIDYEIFIPNKKYVEKRKAIGLPYPVSTFVQKSAEKVTPVNTTKNELKNRSATPNSQKKVEFNLSANCSQDYKEYSRKVKNSTSKVPFDASKKPVQGLLKNSTPSPINPFYKKTLNFLISPSLE